MNNEFFVLGDIFLKPNAKRSIIVPQPCRVEQVNDIGGLVRGWVADAQGRTIGRLEEGLLMLKDWVINLESGGGGSDGIYIFCQKITIEGDPTSNATI